VIKLNKIKKNKINLSNLKKILIEKGFVVKKKRSTIFSNDFKSFYLTAICSFGLILIFSLIPLSVNIKDDIKVSKSTVDNNSNVNFQKVLDGKSIQQKNVDVDLDVKNLFEDIFSIDEVPTDTVRLSAETINQLFKDTKYNLDKVRETKIVKPIRLSLLPTEIKKIENTKKKKNLFIQIILPLVLEENSRIRLDRKKLFSILNKNMNSDKEKKWLLSKFKQYGVVNNDLSTLKVRMDIIPVSLAIAQAAKETGWGTSRFAIEGNALFGQWTWSGEGIKPAGVDSEESSHKVMKFKVLKASVRAYQRNLNTHGSYKNFRSARANMRDSEEELDSLVLAEYLDKYAATGKEYTKIIKQIIKQNDLQDFDKARLLPSSIQLKNII